jgi:hypothetical protein
MVEFCTTTAVFTDADAEEAEAIRVAIEPALEAPAQPQFFRAPR